MMDVDLHTRDPVLLPSQFLLPDMDDDVLSYSDKNNNNNHGSPLKPPQQLVQMEDKDDDDFINDLTHHMARFTLQDDDQTFIFSDIIGSSQTQSFESSWDLMGSPQSTLWSPMSYNQGSSEGSSQEPSPPATPGNNNKDSCWNSTTTYDMFDQNLKLGNSIKHPGYVKIQNQQSSNIGGDSSHKALIQDQIRAIELCRLKKEKFVSPNKQEIEDQILKQLFESKHETHKKGKRSNGRRSRPPPPRPAPPPPPPQTCNSGMRAVILGGSGSRGGTGVFLPQGASPSSKSTNKQGLNRTQPQPNPITPTVLILFDQQKKHNVELKPRKGCSSVLIPARVAQALQQHFDKTASISGPKFVGFPPLNGYADVVSDRDGMYSSLENLQSMQVEQRDVLQNEMILPREWTY